MKASSLLLSLLLSFSPLLAQTAWPEILNEEAEFSLLTCSPGDDVHNVFGHSALRLKDKSGKTDIVFNWGTFNFRTPNFVMKFIRGKLPYRLSLSRFSGFVQSYANQGRSVNEQVLDLSQTQKAKLNALLKENYLEENRTYRYDFFFDNCSTRIRDHLEDAADGQLQFQETEQVSFRKLLQTYLVNHEWLKYGINLILGYPADAHASNRNRMFLPLELESAFDNAQIGNRDLVKENLVLSPLTKSAASPLQFKPLYFLILLLALTLASIFFSKRITLFHKLFMSLIGLIGWFFLFMWFGTDHIATARNLNLLWAFPFFFPLIWFLKSEQIKRFLFIPAAILAILFLLARLFLFDVFTIEVFLTVCIAIPLSAMLYSKVRKAS